MSNPRSRVDYERAFALEGNPVARTGELPPTHEPTEEMLEALHEHLKDLPRVTDLVGLDMRDQLINSAKAAEIIGVKRTQLWRYVTQSKKLRCFVGGSDSRPVYYFLRDEVEAFGRDRRSKKASRQIQEMQRRLKKLRNSLGGQDARDLLKRQG